MGDAVSSSEEPESAPRFTTRHLRADVDLDACARRIVREMYQRRDTKRNYSASAGFALSSRLIGDIATAHSELVTPGPAAFPTPTDLSIEEQHVYRAAAIGYRTAFPEPFVLAPLADDWETTDPETGYRWVASTPLAGIDESGQHRIRHVAIGRGAADLDAPTYFMLALRTDGWADEVLIDPAALLDADRRDPLRIDAEVRAEARAWAGTRAEALIALGPDPRPRMGRDCLGCAYVAKCTVHR